MKLLLFSDLHCDARAARRLVQRSPEFDVLVGAGDFANARQGLNVCVDVLRGAAAPVVLVPGNGESYEELRDACSLWPQAHVLHGSAVEIAGTSFYGLGGGVPVTPFGSWSYDFTEQQAAELLAGCPARGVLVSHSPPQGVLDESSSGHRLGSTAVRAAVLRARPALVVCGHIHHCAGQQARLGDSVVVNAGPAGVAWEL